MDNSRVHRFVILFFILLLSCAGLRGENERTFTNQSGQTIKASLESFDGEYVEIRRSDGRFFTIPVETLSEEDQKYINLWEIGRGVADERKFLVSIDKDYSDEAKKSYRGYIQETKKGFYEIELENKTGTLCNGLKVDWAIRLEKVGVGKSKDRKNDKWVAGKFASIDLPDDGVKLLTTDTVTLVETKLKSGFYWVEGGPEQSRDRLNGIYLAIYLDGEIVREFSSPSGLLEDGREVIKNENSDLPALY
tara:strand:+ start:14564 stop:15310 length:747 start_codon:yes stop_codon:yes gene_type:complete